MPGKGLLNLDKFASSNAPTIAMLIKNLKVSGLLSFGIEPNGIDLDLGNLNILIGPNGSGKSNLIEILALLKAAPNNLPEPVKEMGGVREWLWKGPQKFREAKIEATINYPNGQMPLRHGLCVAEHGGRFEVTNEWIQNERRQGSKPKPYLYYDFQNGSPVLNELDGTERKLRRENVMPDQSILSQLRDPELYPELRWLRQQYDHIRMFRNWSFGPGASLRREQSTHGRSDFLEDGGQNLALVLSKIRSSVKTELIDSLKKLYEGIEDIQLTIDGGNVLLFLEENGGKEIPATRLSDGTLRYLCLLAILLHPAPPPLIAIEEPELGLHPDIIPQIAGLLLRASRKTQLVVTTHSRMLIDAFTEEPSCVIVCDKEDGQSKFKKLNSNELKMWLEKYTLGQLWSMGELGGNRW